VRSLKVTGETGGGAVEVEKGEAKVEVVLGRGN
jgi:hypothetical protein